jgi:methyltransferase (TIGR00027 family)
VPVSRTAAFVAFYRALETEVRTREPLFYDPFAIAFLPLPLALAVRAARVGRLRRWIERYADYRAPGARSSAIARTRFIDDLVRRANADGSRQLVVLGAGFDCRAHRLDELAESRVFEVDRADTQQAKRARLALVRESPPRSDIRYVAVDFLHDDLGKRLAAAGWSSEARSLFVWEGVSNYLSEPAVAEILSLMGRAARGSIIVFTYIHRGVLDGSVRFEGADKLLRNVQRLGEPWSFGLDPAEVPSFVRRFGLELEQDVGADDYRQRYQASWGSGLRGYAFYRIAACRVTAQPGLG